MNVTINEQSSPTREGDSYDPVAIVGFSLRFPGEADSTEGFWDMLIDGRCASSNFPEDRLNFSGHYHPDGTRHDTVSRLY